jgi:hypothetical protein
MTDDPHVAMIDLRTIVEIAKTSVRIGHKIGEPCLVEVTGGGAHTSLVIAKDRNSLAQQIVSQYNKYLMAFSILIAGHLASRGN